MKSCYPAYPTFLGASRIFPVQALSFIESDCFLILAIVLSVLKDALNV